MKHSHNLQFSIPPRHPRFLSKRSIKGDLDQVRQSPSPSKKIHRHYDSDKKLNKLHEPGLPPEGDLLKRPLQENEPGLCIQPLGVGGECRKIRNENSWRERYSSHKNISKGLGSERRLRHSYVDSQGLDAGGFPSFRKNPERDAQGFQRLEMPRRFNVANYFSDRNLATPAFKPIKAEHNHFHLEMLDEDLLKKKTLSRQMSMRMIGKRGFDNFPHKMPEHAQGGLLPYPNNLGSMKIIDEKFHPISFKSRESFSHSRVGEEPRVQHFSPFPLSKINEGFEFESQNVKPKQEEDFISSLGKGAFRKVAAYRDQTTKAVTRSDMRIKRNSVISSPFEYNHQFKMATKLGSAGLKRFDQKGNRSGLGNGNVLENLPFQSRQTGSRNDFNSQRKISEFANIGRTSTLSWKHIKMPWSAKQINNVFSNRRISFNNELGPCLKETLNLLGENPETHQLIQSKRDLLNIETKYIGQEGEDKSVIEENLKEQENLSAEEPIQHFEGFKKIVEVEEKKSGRYLDTQKEPPIEKGFGGKKKHSKKKLNQTSLEKKDHENKLEGEIQPFPIATKTIQNSNELSGEFSKEKQNESENPESREGSSEKFLTELKDEKGKILKIKKNLNNSLEQFDLASEFKEFHNLLGLLSCLFVTGEIEDRYLILNSDEKAILVAIVYRKFKRSLDPK